MNFRYRLALFLIATLAAVQALTAICAYAYLHASLLDRAKGDLAAATRIFTRQLGVISERVSSDVEVLSLDYALRQAIAQQDYNTELSALRNHGRRVGATRMMLVGLDGTIAADTGSARTSGRTFPYANMLSGAAMKGQSTALANLDGKVYWIVAVPVLAPVPIAFIAACIPVDNALLEKLRGLSTVPRAIALATTDATGRWTLAGRTANGPKYVPVPESGKDDGATSIIHMPEGDYLTVTARLPTAQASPPVMAVLSYPLSEAFATYRAVVKPVLAVLGLALLAALAGAFFVVRRVSRPLEALAVSAGRIAKGDYTPPPPLKQSDEIGQLSRALATMAGSIAEREAALTAAIEAAEVARNEAVSANEAKSQFLANMSHELRTPLNAIVGFGEMLHQQVLGPLGAARYAEYARDICASGEHLLRLVSRMLDLADIEAGRMTIETADISAGDILSGSLTALAVIAKKADVELSPGPAPAKWPMKGDAGRLRQAFGNILHNAVKFTPAGGRVTVRTEAAKGSLLVRVEDTGIGMKPADIALVTRPFQRLRHALDGQHQGAGLGLSYANAIVTLHGGTLTIASEPGVGTTVEIRLPLLDALEIAA